MASIEELLCSKMTAVTLFRLDHRTIRDQRITSHVALTARALGATSFLYCGEKDENMEQSITDVTSRWGGSYSVEYVPSIRRTITSWKGIVVHLTMYGEAHMETIDTLQQLDQEEPILLIVGGPKVPRYVYALADFNTAIGWQPHSEVAATAIFLHDLLGNSALYHKYDDASIVIEGDGNKSQRSDRFTSN